MGVGLKSGSRNEVATAEAWKSGAQPVFDLVLAKKPGEILETEKGGEQKAKGRGVGWDGREPGSVCRASLQVVRGERYRA